MSQNCVFSHLILKLHSILEMLEYLLSPARSVITISFIFWHLTVASSDTVAVAGTPSTSLTFVIVTFIVLNLSQYLIQCVCC